MNTEQYRLNKWLICPNTGRHEVREPVTAHPIPGGWAVWWRCSSCNRWHMVEIPAPAKNSPRLVWGDSSKTGKGYLFDVQP